MAARDRAPGVSFKIEGAATFGNVDDFKRDFRAFGRATRTISVVRKVVDRRFPWLEIGGQLADLLADEYFTPSSSSIAAGAPAMVLPAGWSQAYPPPDSAVVPLDFPGWIGEIAQQSNTFGFGDYGTQLTNGAFVQTSAETFDPALAPEPSEYGKAWYDYDHYEGGGWWYFPRVQSERRVKYHRAPDWNGESDPSYWQRDWSYVGPLVFRPNDGLHPLPFPPVAVPEVKSSLSDTSSKTIDVSWSETSPSSEPEWVPPPLSHPSNGSAHRFEPPGRRVKEKKLAIAFPNGTAAKIVAVVGEIPDFIDSIWKGLPANVRSKARWDKYYRTGHKLSPQDKALLIYRNINKVDWFKAIQALAMNELEDQFYGRIGAIGKRANKGSLSAGWMLGPADSGGPSVFIPDLR